VFNEAYMCGTDEYRELIGSFLLFFRPHIFWWNTFNILHFVDFVVLLVLFLIPFA
jgi:hypothetical protein